MFMSSVIGILPSFGSILFRSLRTEALRSTN